MTNHNECSHESSEGRTQSGGDMEAAASVVAEGCKNAVQEAGRVLSQQSERATQAIGRGLQQVGDSVLQNSPEAGTLHDASERVAETLNNVGDYLDQNGVNGMSDDLTQVIRKNPIPSVLLGMAIGFLISKATTRNV